MTSKEDRMATTQHPAPPANPAPEPAIPPPVETVADEQRRRSEEIEKIGVEKWKAAHDQRTEAPRQVEGVRPKAP
jgi:hypothetical protein